MVLKEVEIKDAFEVVSGSTPSTTVEEYWENGNIKWITPKDLSSLKTPFIESTERNITELGLKNCSANLIPANSIIVSSRAPIGYVAVLKDSMTCNQGCKALVPKNGNIDSLYAYYLLTTKVDEMNRLGSGSTFKEISKSKLETIKIKLPDLTTQQKIASILAQADAARQKRKQANQLTEQFLQSAFLEMFGDPVRNEKGWAVKTIEGLIKNERHALKRGPFGGALKKEIFVPSGYLVYEQFHALNNDFTFARYFIDEEKFQELKAFEVKEGDIIISCSGVYLGKLAIVPKGAIKGIINQALLKITLDEKKITNHFFVYLFSHPSFKNRFYGNISGTGIPNFPSMDDFKKFQFIYPPLPLQKKFAALVEQTERLRTKQRESERELDNLFQSLMQRYFS